jgi:hypothetical protein
VFEISPWKKGGEAICCNCICAYTTPPHGFVVRVTISGYRMEGDAGHTGGSMALHGWIDGLVCSQDYRQDLDEKTSHSQLLLAYPLFSPSRVSVTTSPREGE